MGVTSVTSTTRRIGVYLRVSSEEQRERQTIATQRDFAERFCALHDIPIYGWYADDGISGTIALDKRPEGNRLLQDARDGRLSEILLYRLDRIGRDPWVILDAVKRLEELGVQVRSMTEAFDTSTPAGRLFLTMLSGFAGFERDSIVQRSVEGTNRLARAGTWLGGIVPYGYIVEGKDRDARLVVSECRIEGCDLAEADVIRLIYRRTVDDDWPCQRIADELNALGVPPAYVRDGRELLRGKRTGRTQGIWRPGRIRNMIVNPTYKGLHRYGVRAKKAREVIEREVPAIVSVEVWESAQQKLRAHMVFSSKNAKHDYLLRGLITCGCCGLTYSGSMWHAYRSTPKRYYRCNGSAQYRGIFGGHGEKCPSKAINGERLEAEVWADVDGFLRDPGPILEQLAERRREQGDQGEHLRDEIARLQQLQQAKQREKDAVITLFRRGRIDAAALDRQLDQIQQEETHLRDQVDALHERMRDSQAEERHVQGAADLLTELRPRLDEPLTWELKRQLVERLVARIVVDTDTDENGRKRAKVRITYRFDPNDKMPSRVLVTRAAIGMGRDSSPPPA
jgi:site-specific DNA recombinase